MTCYSSHHSSHTACGCGCSSCGCVIVFDIRYTGLSGQQAGCDAGRILQSRASDLGRIKDAGVEHVDILSGQSIIARTGLLGLYFVDNDRTVRYSDGEVNPARVTARMMVDLGAVSREDAIAALAKAMEDNHFISNADSLVTAAMDREAVLSTAMDDVAFPHVRGVEGGGLTLAMGVSKEGIDWAGEKVHLVFLSAIPVAVSAFYLRLMAGLAQAFSKPDVRAAAIASKDAAALWKTLVKATRHTVK